MPNKLKIRPEQEAEVLAFLFNRNGNVSQTAKHYKVSRTLIREIRDKWAAKANGEEPKPPHPEGGSGSTAISTRQRIPLNPGEKKLIKLIQKTDMARAKVLAAQLEIFKHYVKVWNDPSLASDEAEARFAGMLIRNVGRDILKACDAIDGRTKDSQTINNYFMSKKEETHININEADLLKGLNDLDIGDHCILCGKLKGPVIELEAKDV